MPDWVWAMVCRNSSAPQSGTATSGSSPPEEDNREQEAGSVGGDGGGARSSSRGAVTDQLRAGTCADGGCKRGGEERSGVWASSQAGSGVRPESQQGDKAEEGGGERVQLGTNLVWGADRGRQTFCSLGTGSPGHIQLKPEFPAHSAIMLNFILKCVYKPGPAEVYVK